MEKSSESSIHVILKSIHKTEGDGSDRLKALQSKLNDALESARTEADQILLNAEKESLTIARQTYESQAAEIRRQAELHLNQAEKEIDRLTSLQNKYEDQWVNALLSLVLGRADHNEGKS